MPWVDDFLGNKLSSKWVATRLSQGGQNDGIWYRDVRNSKIYWTPTGAGTEGGYWGEWLSLPVNAVGDITVEALIRSKITGGVFGGLGIGVNHSGLTTMIRNGVELNLAGAGTNYKYGRVNGAVTAFPGRPSQVGQGPLGVDVISKVRVVRRNGYIFLYIDDTYVGQSAFAAVITTADIYAFFHQAPIAAQKWVDYFKVWPSAVVL